CRHPLHRRRRQARNHQPTRSCAARHSRQDRYAHRPRMNAPVSLARVDLIGVDALRALEPGAGEIAAVFRRSLYIRSGEAWACIGTPGIGAGPLNIVTDLRCDWSAMVALGQPVRIDDRRLRIGVLALDLAGAAVWSPPPFPDWNPACA